MAGWYTSTNLKFWIGNWSMWNCCIVFFSICSLECSKCNCKDGITRLIAASSKCLFCFKERLDSEKEALTAIYAHNRMLMQGLKVWHKVSGASLKAFWEHPQHNRLSTSHWQVKGWHHWFSETGALFTRSIIPHLDSWKFLWAFLFPSLGKHWQHYYQNDTMGQILLLSHNVDIKDCMFITWLLIFIR